MGINVSPPTAVIQAKRGIGDVVWHLPFVRAIAAVSPGGTVAFLAPPSSRAKELLAAEPSIAEILYFEHSGSELMRVVNMLRLAALLRRCRFRALWMLDRTVRPAIAGALAGIPQRIGVGFGPQRLFITNRGIDASHFDDFPIDYLAALMTAMQVPLPTIQPELRLNSETVAAVGAKFSSRGRPWIVVGLGGSHPDKDWPDSRWLEFLDGLRRCTNGTVFLIGGVDNTARARQFATHGTGASVINGCDLKLDEAAALLHHADVFVGPDSAPMNIAAATGTPAFGLFGATTVLTNSKFIHPIVPEGGPAPGGMRQITPAQVLERVEAYLSAATHSQ